jgi:hypothetical protein
LRQGVRIQPRAAVEAREVSQIGSPAPRSAQRSRHEVDVLLDDRGGDAGEVGSPRARLPCGRARRLRARPLLCYFNTETSAGHATRSGWDLR